MIQGGIQYDGAGLAAPNELLGHAGRNTRMGVTTGHDFTSGATNSAIASAIGAETRDALSIPMT